jgi:hypothetical protein
MLEHRRILVCIAVWCGVAVARPIAAEDVILEVRGNGAAAAAVVQQVVVVRDGQRMIERRVIILGDDGVIVTNAQSRERLDKQLAELIVALDAGCSLSDAQKRKLTLAGRGDIKQRLEQWEELNRQFPPAKDRRADAVRFEQDQERVARLMSTDVFGEESLLRKTMRHVLTLEQFARSEQLQTEREFAALIAAWDERTPGVKLTPENRHKLAWLLLTKFQPPPSRSKLAQQVLLLQLAYLEAEATPLFDKDDQAALAELLRDARDQEAFLHSAKAWPVTPQPPQPRPAAPVRVGF